MPTFGPISIDRSSPRRSLGAFCPGSLPWMHDIIRATCPSALEFSGSSAIGSVIVSVRVSDKADASPLMASKIGTRLTEEGPAGVSFAVDGMSVEHPAPGLWTSHGEPFGAATANAEINRLRAEVERLVRESAARLDDARGARSAGQEAVDLAKQLRIRYDEMTRAYAGLDDSKWSVPDREKRRALVRVANELLNEPSGFMWREYDGLRSASPGAIAAKLRKAWTF